MVHRPPLLIVHGSEDSQFALSLADAFNKLGYAAMPLGRILATPEPLEAIIAPLFVSSAATILIVTETSARDRVFVDSVATLKKLDVTGVPRPPVAAVRFGTIELPAIVNGGFVIASKHHLDQEGSVSVAHALLACLRASTNWALSMVDSSPINHSIRTPRMRAHRRLSTRRARKESAPAFGRQQDVEPNHTSPTRPSTEPGRSSPESRNSRWRTALEVVALAARSDLLLLAIGSLAVLSLLVLIAQKGTLFIEYWWVPSLSLLAFVALRALAGGFLSRNASDPKELERRRPLSWAPRLAAIIGATATAIAGLFKGGETAVQHVLTAKSAWESAATARDKELINNAKSYLKMALEAKHERSIDERLTVLNFVRYAPSGAHASDSTSDDGLKLWAEKEQQRLESQRSALIEILKSLAEKCEKDKCQSSNSRGSIARIKTMARITQQVGPSHLDKATANRVVSAGIPVFLVSADDVDIASLITSADPGEKTFKVVRKCKSDYLARTIPDDRGGVAQAYPSKYCGGAPATAIHDGEFLTWTVAGREVDQIVIPTLQCQCRTTP